MGPGRSLNAEQADQRNVVHQILMPLKFRLHVLSLAHDHPWSGHLGINKIYNRVLHHFFWPGLKTDVSKYCKKKWFSKCGTRTTSGT